MPCHPRIANMLLRARTPQEKALACDVAALLEEKDPMAQANAGADICERIDEMRRLRERGFAPGRWSRITRTAQQYRSLLKAGEDNSPADGFVCGRLLAAAYPERIAKAIDGCGTYRLSSSGTALLDAKDPLSAREWIVAASLNVREGAAGRIFLAAPLDPLELGDMLRTREKIAWDSRRGCVSAVKETRLGSLPVREQPLGSAGREDIISAICDAAPKEGLTMFDFNDEAQNLARRVAAAAKWRPELQLPDLSAQAVLDRAREWIPAFVGKASDVAALRKTDMCRVLWSLLDYAQQQAVERIAPSHIAVPTGSRIKLEYRSGAEAPVLRVRLQECFGLTQTPTVDDGRRQVLMELLSPGYKPVQLTSDLKSFWEGTYFEVRAELRRRYPAHYWPDNPLEAEAVRGVRRKK